MSWVPNEREEKYINLIQSMCLDSLMKKGVKSKKAFISNLRMISNELESIKEPVNDKDQLKFNW